MKLNFYDIDKNYTDFLRRYDNKIPYLEYKDRNKFLCGVVLTVNNINYYVPVSSNKSKFLSSFMIYDESGNKKITSSLRFSFMFPCLIESLTLKDLSLEKDIKYKILTQKEYEYCNKHITEIKKKAMKIYNLSKNEQLREKYNLCNFQLLEEKCVEYARVDVLFPTLKNITNKEDLYYIYDNLGDLNDFEDIILALDNMLNSQKINIQDLTPEDINNFFTEDTEEDEEEI